MPTRDPRGAGAAARSTATREGSQARQLAGRGDTSAAADPSCRAGAVGSFTIAGSGRALVRQPVARRGTPWGGRQRTTPPTRRWCACLHATARQHALPERLQLGLLTAQPTLSFGELRALPRPLPDQIGPRVGDHPQHVTATGLRIVARGRHQTSAVPSRYTTTCEGVGTFQRS